MIYLKTFNNESDYLAYRDGKKYGKPNVSLSVGSKAVHYNYPPIDTNGFDFVNLKLPSGTLWAMCNVGASSPYDSGLYFQWGDSSGYTASQVGTSEGKKAFSWNDYKWSIDGSDTNFSKYTTKGATLELEDDAAHANMGGDCHMPTFKQFRELTANTTISWTTLNGVSGNTFTSNKDSTKSIFIPGAGSALEGVTDKSNYSYFWFPFLSYREVSGGEYFYFSPDSIGGYSDYIPRYHGYSIRGVIDG